MFTLLSTEEASSCIFQLRLVGMDRPLIFQFVLQCVRKLSAQNQEGTYLLFLRSLLYVLPLPPASTDQSMAIISNIDGYIAMSSMWLHKNYFTDIGEKMEKNKLPSGASNIGLKTERKNQDITPDKTLSSHSFLCTTS